MMHLLVGEYINQDLHLLPTNYTIIIYRKVII